MVVSGVTWNSLLPTVILPVALAALHSCTSTHLGSLKVWYWTMLPAEWNSQYWLITDSITMERNTGTVQSLFIWTISPKMVLSTSWLCSVVGNVAGFSWDTRPPCWWSWRSCRL
jgi:hypothetical protein